VSKRWRSGRSFRPQQPGAARRGGGTFQILIPEMVWQLTIFKKNRVSVSAFGARVAFLLKTIYSPSAFDKKAPRNRRSKIKIQRKYD
jgi:hypothetical protein